jgi:hypothetical protein
LVTARKDYTADQHFWLDVEQIQLVSGWRAAHALLAKGKNVSHALNDSRHNSGKFGSHCENSAKNPIQAANWICVLNIHLSLFFCR